MTTLDSFAAAPRSHWLAPLLLGLLFGAFVIQHSLHQGSLSAPTVPDDITYLADSGAALQLLYAEGPPRFLWTLISAPPHSPFAFTNTLVAFAIFGLHDWAPVALNVLWLVVFLYGIRRFLHDLSTFEYLAVAMCVLAWPLSAFLVMEARPDIVFGLTLAGLVYFLALGQSPLPWRNSRRAAGLLLGAILLIKPSALPLTLALAGGALLIAIFKARNTPDWPRSARKSALLLLGTATIIAGTYYLFAGRDVFNYIYSTTFGAEREIWSLDLSIADHLLFYLTGRGGRALYSWWLPITLLLGCAVALIEYRRKGRLSPDVPVAALGILLTLIVVTVPGHKSFYFGFTLAAFALFTFLIFARFLFRVASGSPPVQEFKVGRPHVERFRLALSLLFIGTALLTFKVPWHHRSGGGTELEPAVVSEQRHKALADVVDSIQPASEDPVRIYFPSFTAYLNSATVRFELIKRRLRNIVVTDGHRNGDIEVALPEIARASHVVLPNDNNSELLSYLPSTALVPRLRARLAADPAFRRIATIHGIGADTFEIFEREHPFAAARFIDGFLPTEGPYPQWNLPVVKWATGPRATLKLENNTMPLNQLVLTMQSAIPQQRVTVRSGATFLGSCDIPVPGKVVECGIPLLDMQPDRIVALEFERAEVDVPPHRAVLFHSIRMQ